MADLVLLSETQIQQRMLSKLINLLSLNDVNAGSVIDVITQAAAQEDFALYYNLAQVSRLADINALSGDDLDLKAFEFGLTRVDAAKATGNITIQRPEGFVKVATSFFAGSASPIAGQTVIDVNDASSVLYGTSGTLIVGRGTNNEEEVTYSVAPVDNTTHWTITLDGPGFLNNHALEETVILKQGSDVTFVAGTIVVVPATGTNAEIQFAIDNDAILLAGEAELEGVGVTAVVAGTSGNIGVQAIEGEDAFPSSPLIGARAFNPSKFTTGVDRESDDSLRDRIRSAGDLLTKGVKSAISSAIVGLVDSETAKRVVSASIVLPVTEAGDVKIYIDDGTGFEPSFISEGQEVIRKDATGGEQRLQLDKFPVAKAFLETANAESYDMSSGSLTLIYEVSNAQEIITFELDDFATPSNATAEEITQAINDKSTLIEARTSQAGKQVTITARADINEDIQLIGGTANSILGFPTNRQETVSLYLDDVKLTKDGVTAVLDSGNTAPYDLAAIGAFPHTLTVVVDGKTANVQTASFAASDAVNTSAVTPAEIAAVLNRDLAGLVATALVDSVRLESNTKLSTGSKLNVTGGALNDATNGLNFSTVEVSGENSDYIFNRELGLVELNVPLTLNQTVTAGSLFTRGYLRASIAENYSPAVALTLEIVVDGGATQVITFDGSFAGGLGAQATADYINATLLGATAISRDIGGVNFLEIRTDTHDTTGSIEILSTSTGNGSFGFTEDTEVSSIESNQAFVVSGNSTPYEFVQNDNLVVVVDNNITDNTFSIVMNYDGALTGVTSTTVFADSSLSGVFTVEDELIDYYVAFLTGGNTETGTLTTVANQGGNTFRYTYSPVPPTFVADYSIGDLFAPSGMDDTENDGFFIVTGKGADWVEVTNPSGLDATLQTGTGLLSQRRQITDYEESTGEMTVGSAFNTLPVATDTFILIPSTATNVVEFLNNVNTSSLSLKAIIEGVEDSTKVQISSKSPGSEGYIQVTGGSANTELGFSTTQVRGRKAYDYWTGLMALVHRTVYGDDTDLVAFPGVGAAGITFRVLAPTVREIFVTLDVTLTEGTTLASIENEIKSAVTGYVNNLGVGEDLVVEEIRAAVIRINNVTNVSVSNPTGEILPTADNEIVRVSDSAISIG